MNTNLAFKLLSLVCFLFVSVSWGAGVGSKTKKAVTTGSSEKNTETISTNSQRSELGDAIASCGDDQKCITEVRNHYLKGNSTDICKKLDEDYQTALGRCGQNCQKNVTACYGGAPGEDSDSVTASIIDILAGSSAVSKSESKSVAACDLEMTPDEWKSAKKTLDQDISDLQDKISKAQKELADVDKTKNEKLLELDKRASDEKEAFEAKNLAMNDEMRKKSEETERTRNSANAELRKLNASKLDIRSKINQLFNSTKQKLNNLSDAAITRTCTANVKKYMKDNQIKGSSSGNISSILSQGLGKQADLKSMYEDCLKNFVDQKKSIQADYDDAAAGLNQQMQDLETSIAEGNNTLKLLTTNLELAYNDLKTKMSQAEQHFQESQIRIRKEYDNAILEASKNTALLNQQISQLTQNLNRKYVEQQQNGSKPKTTKSDRSLGDDYNEFKKIKLLSQSAHSDEYQCCEGKNKLSVCNADTKALDSIKNIEAQKNSGTK